MLIERPQETTRLPHTTLCRSHLTIYPHLAPTHPHTHTPLHTHTPTHTHPHTHPHTEATLQPSSTSPCLAGAGCHNHARRLAGWPLLRLLWSDPSGCFRLCCRLEERGAGLWPLHLHLTHTPCHTPCAHTQPCTTRNNLHKPQSLHTHTHPSIHTLPPPLGRGVCAGQQNGCVTAGAEAVRIAG